VLLETSVFLIEGYNVVVNSEKLIGTIADPTQNASCCINLYRYNRAGLYLEVYVCGLPSSSHLRPTVHKPDGSFVSGI
jgi:hypothetical protein